MTSAFDFLGSHEADKALLGGKGAGLATMTRIGLPVPPDSLEHRGLSTVAGSRRTTRRRMGRDVLLRSTDSEALTGRRFGGSVGTPLFLSVRSGASSRCQG